MPFFFILIGFGLLVIGYRGTQKELFALLEKDFSGPGNFFVFALGIFVVGLVGYVPKLKGLSNAFLGLIIVVMILSNKGFFNSLLAQVQSTQTNQPPENNSAISGLPPLAPIPHIQGVN